MIAAVFRLTKIYWIMLLYISKKCTTFMQPIKSNSFAGLALLNQFNQSHIMEADAAPNQGKCNATFRCLLFTVLFATGLAACKKTKWIDVDPAFSQYIEAYTTGIVSKTATIRIRLAANTHTVHAAGEAVADKLFQFSPAVQGKAFWVDATTIEFKPQEYLKPGTLYVVNFKLGAVASVAAERFKKFRFNVQAMQPGFAVQHEGLRSVAKTSMMLSGTLETADVENDKIAEQLLTASINGKPMPISWQHNTATKQHQYTIGNIVRASKPGELLLQWNGKPLGSSLAGKQSIAVPPAGTFKVLDVKAINESQQYASVQLSDAIAIGQDLTGLVSIGGQSDLAYTIAGSEIKVYANGKLDGNYTVNINAGIKNTWGDVLATNYTANINFENTQPGVTIHGSGNILPNSGRLVLPFDAVNLNAVDISIIKVFENNVPRFLQDNNLDGSQSLRRVGKPVVQKTLRLDDDKTLDLHRRQRFMLDIDKYLKTEPGAIYRVTIGFRPQYSLYRSTDTLSQAAGNEEEEEEEEYYGYGDDSEEQGVDEDEAFWQRYDTYYPYGYSWSRRDDPSSKSYYNKDRWATRNILASNIGLTAKHGNTNKLLVAVTDIISTYPMADVELEVLDYQQVVVGKGRTGSSGFAELAVKRKPFLLIARQRKDRAYLKLDDGNSLSMSRFEVSGTTVQQGIKGFIFGERGVWRPGDSLFINCIIEDKTNRLPKDHPIVFSLYTPQGQLYKQLIQSGAAGGFYVFKTATDAGAPTGNWMAKIKCGGALFEKQVKIETVMPNRLKVNLDFGTNARLGVGGVQQGVLNAKWLFGAVGKNLTARVDAYLQPSSTTFDKYAGYSFYNPTASFSTQQKTIFEGTLNDAGDATITPKFETYSSAPGMLSAHLLVKVFEPGGAFSIDEVTMPCSPFASYAGLKLPDGEKPFDYLLSGKTHTVQLANVDANGKPLTGTHKLQLQLYRIQWRWWWDDNGDNLTNFTQNEYNKLIKTDTVNVTNGKAQWNFSGGNDEWGRYLILATDMSSGHTAGKVFYIDEPGWQSRSNGAQEQSAATLLPFSSNKTQYNVGDEIVLTIPSSKGGQLLVSLESGSKVIRHFWQETAQGQTLVKFKAEAEMAPNIFATVSLLQPHSQTLNDLPIRMYGSIPLMVEDKQTRLQPLLTVANAVRPEQQVSFSVSEQQGRAMYYSVAVVDEGLLDLTHHKTPDPHSAFYAKEALGVKTFDLFDHVIGAWAGGLERILNIGGDGDAGPVQQKKANRFKPVVAYLGPFKLEKGATQSHSFTMPAYIGAVRMMVVAAQQGSYGYTQKNVTVKKPLMLLATLPRVLGPGETIKLPVTIFAMEKNVNRVAVSMQNNPLLELTGSATQNIDFKTTGEQMVYFDVRVKGNTGIGKVKIIASSGTEKASCEVELDVRNPNASITQVTEMVLAPGQQWATNASAIGNNQNSTAVLEISSVPAINLQHRLQYLVQYPHGCLEQTTSAVFPQLVLGQLTDLDSYNKALTERNIKTAITRLYNVQRPDGGFAYWPGMPESDDWGSSYAGHFLAAAQAAGYQVSESMVQQWKNYQRSKAANWVASTRNFYGGDLAQAYRLYTLALTNATDLGAMNRLKEFKYLSPEAKWRLAAAYQLAGQSNIALALISGLPLGFAEPESPGFTYGAALRDEAMVLETLTLMNRRTQATEVMKTVAARLSKKDWYSTQATAFALMAVAKYCGKNTDASKILARAVLDGKATEISSSTALRQIPLNLKTGKVAVTLSNKGSNTLYARIITTGQPVAGDSTTAIANPAILRMQVAYISQNGQTVPVSKLTQGTDFYAKVTLTNTGKTGTYAAMALSQVFASGWEIINARMYGGDAAFSSSASQYQDIRDDRVYTYFNLAQNETVTYLVQLNAAYPGRYYLPGTNASAMYNQAIAASERGRWVEVMPGK
jgi:alpha-2-macroglobulin